MMVACEEVIVRGGGEKSEPPTPSLCSVQHISGALDREAPPQAGVQDELSR